jgi:hypothetical protein
MSAKSWTHCARFPEADIVTENKVAQRVFPAQIARIHNSVLSVAGFWRNKAAIQKAAPRLPTVAPPFSVAAGRCNGLSKT